MRYVGLGLFLLALGLFLTWLTLMQIRARQVTGETIFDVAGAVIPPLKPLMFWASTVFLGLLAVVALIGSVVHFMVAMGLA